MHGAPLRWLLLMVAALPACRAEVHGHWVGELTTQGDADAALIPVDARFDQAGAVVEGEVCEGTACGDLRAGALDESSLTFRYGCDGAGALTCTEASLRIDRGELFGDAVRVHCDASDGPCRFDFFLTPEP